MSKSKLSSRDQEIRLSIYKYLVETGIAPMADTLASHFSVAEEEIASSFHRLASARALVLKPGTSVIWMAHPFSAVPTPYPVKTSRTTYYANCAWDALGIPALLHVDSLTETDCPDCQEPLTIRVTGDRPTRCANVIHFAVAPRHFWDDVGFT